MANIGVKSIRNTDCLLTQTNSQVELHGSHRLHGLHRLHEAHSIPNSFPRKDTWINRQHLHQVYFSFVSYLSTPKILISFEHNKTRRQKGMKRTIAAIFEILLERIAGMPASIDLLIVLSIGGALCHTLISAILDRATGATNASLLET